MEKVLSICGEQLNMLYIDNVESLQEKVDNLIVTSKLMGYTIESELYNRICYLSFYREELFEYSIKFYMSDGVVEDIIVAGSFFNDSLRRQFEKHDMNEFLDMVDRLTRYI